MTTSPAPQTTTEPVRTGGRFSFADWQESPVSDGDRMPRIARASVVNSFSGGIRATATTCEYVILYAAETAGGFTGVQLFSGSVDGREGTFAVEERGSFDPDGSLRCRFAVVPGSGTGGLAGLHGSGEYTHHTGEESVAYTFTYEIDGAEPGEGGR